MLAHENIDLRSGFRVWESDEILDGSSVEADLLVATGDLLASTETLEANCKDWPAPATMRESAFGIALGHGIVRIVREWLAPMRVIPPAGVRATSGCVTKTQTDESFAQKSGAKRIFVAHDEDTDRKAIFQDRVRLAHTASLKVATSGHWQGARNPGATCSCEHDPAAKALYLAAEYNVPLYDDYEWDVLNQAFQRFNSLNKKVREGWLKGNGALQRQLRSHLALKEAAFDAEAACLADSHYHGIEIDQLRGDDDSPEISIHTQGRSETYSKFVGPEVARDTARGIQGRHDYGTLYVRPRQVEIPLGRNDAALDDLEANEIYAYAQTRSPVIAGLFWEEARGYEVNDQHRVNDTTLGYFEAQIAAEYVRRETRGDVWLSRKRHGWKQPMKRIGGVWKDDGRWVKDGPEVRDPSAKRFRLADGSWAKGWSPFYAHQQTVRRNEARRLAKRRLLAQLVVKLGYQLDDPRIVARIRELGYDAAIEAISRAIQAREVAVGS